MTPFEAIILGIVQGLTEFLPVSSSGHLVLGGVFLGLSEPHMMFDVLVHVATLIATVAFYRVELGKMFSSVFKITGQHLKGQGGFSQWWEDDNLKLSLLIVIATIPTGLIGIFFKDIFEGLFQSPVLVASMLTATAALLWTTRFAKNNNKGVSQLKWWHAVILGVAQGAAIVPGISRSGTTISVALLLGVERELAARFSFLMAIPAILGALVLQLRGGVALAELASLPNILGFVAAGAVGIGALALLIPLVRKGQLHYFAFYLIPLSLGSILWLI